MFEQGDFVWGKIRSYPYWPAIVVNAKECGQKQRNSNKLWLFWFGDHQISEVDKEKVMDFKDNFLKNYKKSSGKIFKKSVEEVLQILASQHRQTFQDESSLLNWANSGFPSSVSQEKLKNSKLPIIVETALSAMKKSVEESEDNDSDSDDELCDVIRGKKNLEDICISCCKKDKKIIAPHPLLIGSVCTQCKKFVSKVCKLPAGQTQDLCIICGLGGSLVYCSSKLCLRSYCQVCIEYMVSEEEFKRIVKDKEWLCYLCKVDPDKKCLIKRRTIHLANTLSRLPSAPKVKTAVSVLALSENGKNILKKAGIKVLKYNIHPDYETTVDIELMNYSSNYKDFSSTEIEDLSADLILGSFFSKDLPDDQITCVTKLFIVFYRFLYRLCTSRLHKKNVFFIFLSESHLLDENIMSRILRFLMVKPVSITIGENKYLVWSNISNNVLSRPKIFKAEAGIDNNAVEEKIMFPFVKCLEKYFERE